MVLNNSIRELIYINNNKNHYENNLKSILPNIDMFGVEEIYQKNMIKISNKIIELKKGKKKREIHIEKVDIPDSDIEGLPDEISDDEEESEQKIKSDISYVEPPVKDDKLTIISRDIDGSDIDVDEDLDEVVEDLDEESDKDPSQKIDLGPSFLATTAPEWGAAVATDVKPDEKTDKSGVSNMDNMLFSCLERIHKKGGGNIKPNLTQNFKPKENYGGGANIKKIKLTEKYDFF
jgi:hypothetical protein